MIERFLKRHKLTQYRLSQLLGVPQPTLKRWREGNIPHRRLVELALRQLAKDLKENTAD